MPEKGNAYLQSDWLLRLVSKRWLLHLLFWIAVIMDAAINNARYMDYATLQKHLLYSVPLHLVQVYFNVFFLYPTLFEKGKIGRYIVALIICVVVIAVLAQRLYEGKDILRYTPFSYFFFRQLYMQGLSTGALFLRAGIFNYYRMQQIKEAQQKAEINLLHSQVNPHFLFNTLNNLYSLALLQSSRTPDAIMRLSELMRYLNNTAGQQHTLLENEIAYIENYLELEKLRLNAGADIQLYSEGNFDNVQIAPLLLLPFVENAFKHGVETQTQHINVYIRIQFLEGFLYFYIENTQPDLHLVQEEKSGSGLSNVQKRLNILYPDKHHLTINNNESVYSVNLRIEV